MAEPRAKGVGYSWDATIFNEAVIKRGEQLVERCVKLGAQTAKKNMQDLGKGVHSKEFEYPAIQEKNLYEAIKHQVETRRTGPVAEIEGRYGTFKSGSGEYPDHRGYAIFLEEGTSKMRARPWLTMSFDEVLPHWNSIMGGQGVMTG